MSEPPEWVRDYIGIPWLEYGRTLEGVDCWGLLCTVLGKQFGIVVPTYDHITYRGPKKAKDLGDMITRHPEMERWHTVDLEDAVEGDCLLLRLLGHPIHVSVIVAPGIMLHIEENINSFIENYTRALWKDRIIGAYRHESML